jgi:DNA-binding XRE family transcriptional regulator
MLTLKEARSKLYMTQQELADKTGLNKMTIIRLETGKNKPKFKTAKLIAKALKMKPEDIQW